MWIFDWKKLGEIAGGQSLAHDLAVFRDGDEELEAVGEPGEDLADVGNPDFPPDRRDAVGFEDLPESIAGEIAERQVRAVLIIMFSHDFEPCREAVPQFIAPWDTVGGGLAFVDQIKNREQEEGFVRPLVAFAPDADHADVEVVKTFNSRVQVQAIGFE